MHPRKYEYNNVTLHTLITLLYHTHLTVYYIIQILCVKYSLSIMHPCKYEYNNVTVHTPITLLYHTQFMCEVQLINYAPL